MVGRAPQTAVALIKIETKRDLPGAPLGNAAQLRLGAWVVALGHPFGLGHTVTAGIASAKGRIIGAEPYDDFIQTDTSFHLGDSDGPLFNRRGEVELVVQELTPRPPAAFWFWHTLSLAYFG